MLEKMVTDEGGTYLMCDTDSMAIVASERGGLVSCFGGTHKTPEGQDAIKALARSDVRRIVDRFEGLNPYDKKIVPDRYSESKMSTSIPREPASACTVMASLRSAIAFSLRAVRTSGCQSE